MAAMGLWRPTSAPVFPGPVSASSCNSCMACDDCFPPGYELYVAMMNSIDYCVITFYVGVV